MAPIATSGVNTSGFFWNMRVRRGYFRRMTKTTGENISWKIGVAHEKIHVDRRAQEQLRI